MKNQLSYQMRLKSTDFMIVAHRGGGIMNSCISIPENSLEIISMAEALGANCIEIDLQITKDNIPIVFHDDEFSTRTLITDHCYGIVKDYTFSHIRAFARLHNGDRIPSLEEALNYVYDSTDLDLVWLDLKDKDIINHIIPIILKYNNRSGNRNLQVMLGLPTEEIYNTFYNHPKRNTVPSICELSVQQTLDINASIWAPKWTRGINNEQVRMLKSRNIKTVYWTVNDPGAADIILNNRDVGGILSDFPSMVAYKYYASKN